MKFSLALLAAFAGAALADHHYSCTCHNGDSYNWRITSPTCDFFRADQPVDVTYDSTTGRCTSASGNLIDGDSWEGACMKIASEGFACADGSGTCYAEKSSVAGWCD